jgi:hypothetical protein
VVSATNGATCKQVFREGPVLYPSQQVCPGTMAWHTTSLRPHRQLCLLVHDRHGARSQVHAEVGPWLGRVAGPHTQHFIQLN